MFTSCLKSAASGRNRQALYTPILTRPEISAAGTTSMPQEWHTYNRKLSSVVVAPSAAQIARGLRPDRELEREALLHEPAGHDATALEHQLGLAPEQPRADLQHPGGGGQAQPHPPRLAQRAHEVGVGQRRGRSEVDGAVDLVVLDQPIDGAHEVPVMDPRDVLPAVAGLPAEAEAHEAQQQVEHAAAVGAHHDGG